MYPQYIYQMLAQAEALLAEDGFKGPEATAVCYEVLALYPDCEAATELIYKVFCDPWLIREQRKVIGRHIDEWDDRPWQQRRRLSFSFRFLTRWEGRYREYDEDFIGEVVPSDVEAMLEEGRHQLLQAAMLGQGKGHDVAWPIFQDAVARTCDPQLALLWVGELYAEQGYFAEAVDVLEALLMRFPNDQLARRLWAEVRWWRDNQQRIPWVPPLTSSDGSRWRRMMAQVDPNFAKNGAVPIEPIPYQPPDKVNLPDDFELPTLLPDGLIAKIEAALIDVPDSTQSPSLVDWQYLDKLETDAFDVTTLPEWAQYLLLELDTPEQEAFVKWWVLGYLANPPLDTPADVFGDDVCGDGLSGKGE